MAVCVVEAQSSPSLPLSSSCSGTGCTGELHRDGIT